MSDLPSETLKEIEQGLAQTQSKPCPNCGYETRSVAPHVYGLPNLGPSLRGGAGTMPVVAVCCESCGKIDFHQLAIIAPKTYAKGPQA